MAERTNPLEQDLRDIHETRASMTKNLQELEERVQQTADYAKATIFDFVDHVRDRGEDFLENAERFVEHTKRTFDPTYQIHRHPFMMIGAAIMAGYVLGVVESRQGAGRPRPQLIDSVSGEPPAAGQNIWDGIVQQIEEEVEQAKGVLIKVGRNFIHDLFQEILPAILERSLGSRREGRGSTEFHREGTLP